LQKLNETDRILEWYRLYKNGVYGYIFTFVRNHADTEDILQTIFLALVKLGDKTKKIRHPKSYIFRMARNEALKVLKNSDKNGVDDSFLLKIHGSNNIDDFINKQDLQKALEQLSFDEREILIMRVYEGMTFKEIAKITQRFLPSIATKYYRGIKKMKLLLEKNDENKNTP